MGRFNGTLYAINCGNNDSAVVFNKTLLTKAGVKMPWKPKTWADILAAARLVKKNDPGVYPLWMAAGVAAGPTNVLQGSGNLIFGTKTPDDVRRQDEEVGRRQPGPPRHALVLQDRVRRGPRRADVRALPA